MKRAVAMLTALGLALAFLLFWARPWPRVEEAPLLHPAPERRVPAFRGDPIVSTLPVLEEDTGTDEPEPSPYLAMHTRIAEALDYVAITCRVGIGYDSNDYLGRYGQRVANGWYTNVVPQLEGRQVVERRAVRLGVAEDIEPMFVVTWRAGAPGTVVPCEVHPMQYGTLRVRVVDQDGVPLPRVIVYGGGDRGESDESGRAVLEQVRTGEQTQLEGYRHELDRDRREGDWCKGVITLEPLEPDEIRELELELLCLDVEEVEAGGADYFSKSDGIEEESAQGRPILSSAEELARLQTLQERAEEGEEGRKLIESLIRLREQSVLFEQTKRRIDEAEDLDERRQVWDEFLERLYNP